jgi:hypothetical protein
MQLHPISEASVDAKRPDRAAADASSLPLWLSFPRAAICAPAAQLRRRHHGMRCRALGLVPVGARSRQTSRRLIHPPGAAAPAWPLLQRKPADAFHAASGPRSSRQFHHGGPSFFSRFVLALSGGTSRQCATARTGSIRVLLERNPPNRSLRPGRHLRSGVRAQSRSSQTKKELYAHEKRSTRLAEQERCHRPQASGLMPAIVHWILVPDSTLVFKHAAEESNNASKCSFNSVRYESRRYHLSMRSRFRLR